MHCEFNIDTASVELRFSDGTELSIYTLGIDNEICSTVSMQAEIDWLIYNEPLTYAKLVLCGDLERYAKEMAGVHRLKD
ncbi:MAG: DUF6061 family protein [Oscillospiraceae bacterium]|nr:DUF6061 family protein [Oscillospiraceae bacterium]